MQSQAINIFDSRGYTLKLNALVNECSGYTNARDRASANPARTQRCNAWLGPNQPGITTARPDRRRRAARSTRAARADDDDAAARRRAAAAPRGAERPSAPAPRRRPAPAPRPPRRRRRRRRAAAPALDGCSTAPQTVVPETPAPDPAEPRRRRAPRKAAEDLLDYLLGS